MRQSLYIKEEIEKLNKTIFLLEEKVYILEKENELLKKRLFVNNENIFVKWFGRLFSKKSNITSSKKNKISDIQESLRRTG